MNETIKKLGACEEGLDWLGDKPLDAAWAECHRGDWMLWVADKVGVDIKTLTLAKVRCARLVQHLMKNQRSLDVLVIAEAFAGGKATAAQLEAAYAAAAADAAAADAAYAAADAASYAARNKTQHQCAEICRDTIPLHDVLRLIKEQGE